jgi:hypothetical protein
MGELLALTGAARLIAYRITVVTIISSLILFTSEEAKSQ